MTPAAAFAQAPELSLREFASGKIKKGGSLAHASAEAARHAARASNERATA